MESQTVAKSKVFPLKKAYRFAALFFCVMCIALIAGAAGCCDSLFYMPSQYPYASPAEERIPFEKVSFQTADGSRLSGWFFPARTKAKGTIVHCHGNAANITFHWQVVKFLTADFNVLEFDYRGFGESEGTPSRKGTIEDSKAAIDYVMSRPDVDKDKVGLFGQSLGGAVATVVAAEDKRVKAIVIDSAFSSYRSEAVSILQGNFITYLFAYPASWLLVSSGYDPEKYISQIAPRPVYILHGTADNIVPPKMARKLYDRAGDPKELWLVENSPHGAAIFLRADIWEPKIKKVYSDAFGGE